MSVSSISTTTSTSSSSNSSSTSSSSSFDADAFLTLLVEQLQNQDPLNPTDTSQIMSQMVSFASYQQAAESNDTLSDISSTLSAISSGLDISV